MTNFLKNCFSFIIKTVYLVFIFWFIMLSFSCKQNKNNKTIIATKDSLAPKLYSIFLNLRLGNSQDDLFKQIDSLKLINIIQEENNKNDLCRTFNYNYSMNKGVAKCKFSICKNNDNFFEGKFYQIKLSYTIINIKSKAESMRDEILKSFQIKYGNNSNKINRFKYSNYQTTILVKKKFALALEKSIPKPQFIAKLRIKQWIWRLLKLKVKI